MARFILDVGNCTEEQIEKVLEVIHRDDFLCENICSMHCIDKTNDNQFFEEGIKNKLSKKQKKKYNKILKGM